MKKSLLSLLMVVLAVFSISAAETTINTADCTWNGSGTATMSTTSDGYTITITKEGGATNPSLNSTSLDVRAYAKAKIVIASSNGAMSKVSFKISTAGVKRLTTVTPTSGTFEYDVQNANATWTGTESTLEFVVGEKATLGTEGAAKAGQFDFDAVTITTGGAVTTVSKPTFTPAAGTYYEAQQVAINCSTEGATIKYCIDGGDVLDYTAPITVDKTMTITATASKEGLTDATNEAEYVIKEIVNVDNIAAFLTKADKSNKYKITGNMTVLYNGVAKSNHYLFLKDATGCLQVFSAGKDFPQAYKNGDVISGITGTYDEFGNAPQMVPDLTSFAAATDNVPVSAKAKAITEITQADLNDYVYISNVTFNPTDKTISDGTNTFAVYHRFDGVTVPTETSTITISGIVNSYNSKLQIFPISFAYDPVSSADVAEVADATIVANNGNIELTTAKNANVVVYTVAGQAVVNTNVVAGSTTLNVNPGFYIVKVGATTAKVLVK